MSVSVRTMVGIGAIALCVSARPAGAMWPLDRLARTPGDTVSTVEWQEQFQTWRNRPLGGSDSSTTATDEALRKAVETGVFDPSLLAKLAQQAKSGTLNMPTPPGVPPPATATAPKPQSTATPPDSTAPAGMRAAADSLSGIGFGTTTDDSVGTAGSASSLAAGAAGGGPFGGQSAPAAQVFVDRGFAPAFQAGLTSNNDRMRLTSSLSASLSDRSGITLSGSLGRDQELRLSQDAENESNSISTAITAPLRRPGLTLGVSASNAIRSSLGARTTAGRTSDQTENKIASLSAALSRQVIRGVKFDLGYARNFSNDDQTTEEIQTNVSNSRSTQTIGNTYGAGIGFDRFNAFKFRARYGRAVSDQEFTINNTQDSQPSSGDTLQIRVDLPPALFLRQLTADFQMRRIDFSYTDLARTSSGGSRSGFAVETETRFSRMLRINGSIEPWKFLSTTYGVELGRDSVSAVNRKSLFEDSERWKWDLSTTLRYGKSNNVRVTFEGTRADVNKDNPTQPQNPQTRRDESHALTGEVQHYFTTTLKVRAYGNVELEQGFYAYEGPAGFGDRDDFRSQVGIDLDGRISAKATARVQTYVRTFDQAFLDPRRSKDSRDETEYVVRQSFDYQITPKVQLRQFYGLSSKVVDETFDPNGDTLNRNHFLQTTLKFDMTSRLVLDGRYDYRLQDNGFYIQRQPRSTARIFAPSARTKTDEIALGLRYDLIRGGKLTFVSNQVATRDHRTNFFSGRPIGMNVTDRGNLALGLESDITMGSLKLNANMTRNQSFNVSLNRAVYYNVASTLSYTF